MTTMAWAGQQGTASGRCAEFIGALGRGELGRVKECFARDGALLTPDATTVCGREEVARVLGPLAAVQPQITVEGSSTFEAAEVAVLRQQWRITVPGPDDTALTQLTFCSLVLRKINDEWKLAIAAPWGWPGDGPRRVDETHATERVEDAPAALR